MSLLEAAAWGALAALVLGATWWVASKTWMKGGSPTRRAWLILPTYVLAAGVRSVIPVLASGSPDGPGQFPFAVASMTILSVAATLAVDSYRQLALQNGRLAGIRDALAAAESRAQVEIGTLRESARQAIIAAIEQALAGDATGEERAARLRRVSDDIVRPLSHTLAGQSEEMPIAVPAAPQRDLRALAHAILSSRPVRPWPTASLVTVMTLGIIYMIAGMPRVFVAAAVLWSVLASILWLFRHVPWRRLPNVLGITLLCLAFACTGILTVTLLSLMPFAFGGVPRGPAILALLTLIAGGLVALLAGINQQQRWLEEKLITDDSAMVATRRATQARVRRDRRHLARVLHGVVQPRIVARSLRLQQEGGSASILDIAQELDGLLRDEAGATGGIDLARALRDIAEVWSGSTALVEVSVSSGLNEALAAYRSTGRAVVDVACEAVNNAILRAGATRVNVSVALQGEAIFVSATNDVAVPAPPRRTGLGTALFDELTDEWTLQSGPDATEFTARILMPHRGSTAIPDEGRPEAAGFRATADKFV